ncbi:MAG: IS4 family transposase, partial [Sediminibacterium sp.]|nr:IS4 family transposase [Sediminibacterium sp.]
MSLNTAAFSKAKDRLPLELIKEGYNKSKEVEQTHKSLFHNMEVLITDGTYLQLQDTKDIQKNYGTTKGQGYPKGLLQSLIGYGNGIIIDFEFDSYKKSELSLVQNIINRLENNKLLLADDLYNSYGIFSLIQKKNCHIIVPGKRIRNYTVVKCLEKGDEIVELKKAKTNKVFTKKDWESFDNTLKIRRISFKLPNKEEDVILYTTLVDKEITKEEIILLYQSRWDIEINIREIKTIMGMSVIRSKTQNNVLKEVYVTITSYNIARKIIQKSVEKTDFPPQKDILEKIYTINSNILMDKSGRVYNHWSSGRKRKIISENIKTENNT